MNRNKFNFLVDFSIGLFFVASMASGLVRDWYRWHKPISLFLGFLVILHLLLHYKWIICTIKTFFAGNRDCQAKQ